MASINRDTKVKEQFVGKPKLVSWERLWAFSGGPFGIVRNPEDNSIRGGWPVKNIHTDVDFAKSCGLPKVAASATQYEAYAVQFLVDLFGVEWLSHGRMDVKFPNLVDAGDVLTARATVTAREAVRGARVTVSTREAVMGAAKFRLDVSCDNQRAEKVLIGWATGFTGKVSPSGPEEYRARIAELMADSTIQRRQGERELKPLEYVVRPELNQQYCYAQEDFKPWYVEETEFGPPIAHPGLILNWSNATRSPAFVRGGPGREGGVHTHDEAFWYSPARVGEKVRVTWPTGFLGVYQRRGRTYTVSEILVVGEDGREIVRRLSRSTLAATPETPYAKSEAR